MENLNIDNNNSSATVSFTKVIDPKSNKIFNVEKVKNQKIPDHFLATKDKKTILVNGEKVTFMRNIDRTQYVAFEMNNVKYYIRDHSILDVKELKSYTKPKSEKSSTPSVKKVDLLAILTDEQKKQLRLI